MFRAEALVEYYHMFCVGSLYAFNHLTRSSAFDTQEGLMSLFEYDEDISSVQMITPSQYENALQALNTNVSGVMKYGHENTTIDAYITRVVDTLLGVYEVNNSEIICLFKCPKYNALRPFRVSTKLRLHHVHRVSIKAYKSHNSNLFENLWGSSSYQSIDNQKIYGVVIACSRSDLQILSFPVHCDIVQTIHQWASTELLIDVYNKIVHLHILDVFRILEIYCLLYDINVNSREKEIPNLAIQFLSNEIKCTTVDRPIANVFNHSHNQPLLNINHCLPSTFLSI
ncbi:hypothetical protein BY458DRAFT_210744 [Sporodiniella umbellata]|nr:hypothetical protein BY458DRAFT_210744 [Sporodiniella umbellata]